MNKKKKTDLFVNFAYGRLWLLNKIRKKKKQEKQLITDFCSRLFDFNTRNTNRKKKYNDSRTIVMGPKVYFYRVLSIFYFFIFEWHSIMEMLKRENQIVAKRKYFPWKLNANNSKKEKFICNSPHIFSCNWAAWLGRGCNSSSKIVLKWYDFRFIFSSLHLVHRIHYHRI